MDFTSIKVTQGMRIQGYRVQHPIYFLCYRSEFIIHTSVIGNSEFFNSLSLLSSFETIPDGTYNVRVFKHLSKFMHFYVSHTYSEIYILYLKLSLHTIYMLQLGIFFVCGAEILRLDYFCDQRSLFNNFL